MTGTPDAGKVRRLTEARKRELLDEAQRLVERVNEAERYDRELAWRPWEIRRMSDLRRM